MFDVSFITDKLASLFLSPSALPRPDTRIVCVAPSQNIINSMCILISPRTTSHVEYVCDTKAMIVCISKGMPRTPPAAKHSDCDAILLSVHASPSLHYEGHRACVAAVPRRPVSGGVRGAEYIQNSCLFNIILEQK